MDQPGTIQKELMSELSTRLDSNCIDFTITQTDEFYEAVATCEEAVLDLFLEGGTIPSEVIRKLITNRKLYPCFFGSALLTHGVEEFLNGLSEYTEQKSYPDDFGARVFKISRDEQGNRLTYMKITGGKLLVKSVINGEKINQIRSYSGTKYELRSEVQAGDICAVTGLSVTRAGEGLGMEQASKTPVLEPLLTYQLQLPDGCDNTVMLMKLRELEEEVPELHVIWNDTLKEIQVQIMGEVQIEILKSLIRERFQTEVEFGTGHIVYKETIINTVEGVGHFEPLKHYAEVHLLLEPLERGSGMQFALNCSEDILDKNWQRLILTHLSERIHKGVLTGAAITDIRVTVVAGRAHTKHTEGGDFRQATYRALRQGLCQADSLLLEPFYQFRLEIPSQMTGRAMTDIERMGGRFEPPQMTDDTAVISGYVPVASLGEYSKEVISYTKGLGRLFCSFSGYEPCHNADEVIKMIGYEAEHDLEYPSGSVFCAHGAGFIVPWDQVFDHMHVERVYRPQEALSDEETDISLKSESCFDRDTFISVEEVDAILKRATNANKRDGSSANKWSYTKREPSEKDVTYTQKNVTSVRNGNYNSTLIGEDYLLVDGYNIIYAWQELKELAAVNLDGARGALMDIMCNYQALRKCNLILVFDAYRVKGHDTSVTDYHNIHVVYTKEAETADRYIERFAHDHASKHRITVATSDGLEQIIIRGAGCHLLSALDLKEEVKRLNDAAMESFQNKGH